jgi:hypothetical protein
MRFQTIPRRHPGRAAVERLVRDVYQAEYGARIRAFPETMIAVFDIAARPVCAAGLRDARSGYLSEHYLDRPVEAAIAASSGVTVERESIIEVTGLAAYRPGGLFHLLTSADALGFGSGYLWGLFTITRRLRCLARRMNVPLLDLGPARADRLPNAADWGDYYAHDPRVCAVVVGETSGTRPQGGPVRLLSIADVR